MAIKNDQINSRNNPPEVFLGKKCFENLQQIYRRTPIPVCDFDKVLKQLY